MFHTRITEAWGAPVAVQQKYLLERLMELPDGGRIACARERASGIKRWLKFAASPEEEARLHSELTALRRLSHHQCAAITGAFRTGEPVWFALEWQGETPLDADLLQRMPAIDRLRLAPVLVSIVEHLAGCDLAIPSLSVSHFWVTPALHTLRLVGIPGADVQAGGGAARQLRQTAAGALAEILAAGMPSQLETTLAPMLSNWSDGAAVQDEVLAELEQALMVAVTADL